MITFFSTPKPFHGHINVIQRNAIQSWLRVHTDVEVILFGDDDGAADVAREFAIRHVPEVERNEFGTKYLASIFDQANRLARHNLLCYVNCDIILTDDFAAALERVAAWSRNFLMVGRRWDLDITAPLSFNDPEWQQKLRATALLQGRRRPLQWIDYFAYSRGLYDRRIPRFVIGRPGWDNWLVWHARASGAAVVDASPTVVAVHQNHDYGYHPDGEQGVWHGLEAQQNYALLHGLRHYATLENATHLLSYNGLRRNHRHGFVQLKRRARRLASQAWFALLGATRPLRHALGLRHAPPALENSSHRQSSR